ncbi:hypothetical protein GPALN_005955 [Globodera pallida]|nr:hypothetical protein GPALN_005955 [Globodera pallida]
MRGYHPDKNPHGKAMARLFTKAKKTLTDPYKKAIYDQRMYSYATDAHHQQEEPMDFAVVDPVFPKFGEVLKMNKCEGLAEMMKQLTVNVAAYGGLSAQEDKNSLANIQNNLEDVGLNNMMDAFIKALGSKFICNKYKKQLELDDICYCDDAKTNCCDKRKIVAYDWQMYSYATMDQEEPMYFAVGEPVFPKFGEVLKMNQYDGLAVMMEQLAVNAAAYGGLSEENECLLAIIQNNLDDVGLNNMMDAFIKALGAKFICNKCKKQLELDDICYCKDAKTKCHCNSRTCCIVTLKERGKFN